jgi:serine kinase of HPr protein (carbohydrate metabolism regulator)
MLVYGTAIKINDKGVLLRGPSGSGKSDLALRLMQSGSKLISDDQVIVDTIEGVLCAKAPDELAGLLEVRGVGILNVPYAECCSIDLVVDLVAHGDVDRLPEAQTEEFDGICVPKLFLNAFDISTPIKLELFLTNRYPAIDTD